MLLNMIALATAHDEAYLDEARGLRSTRHAACADSARTCTNTALTRSPARTPGARS